MSRGIVNQKPFRHKRRKQSFKKMLNRSGVSIPEFKINQKFKNILSRGALFTLSVLGGFLVLIKLLFFQPGQIISNVKFSDDTEATYKDPYLFSFIANEVKGKNYFILKSEKDELLSKIQKGFKVKNLEGEFVEFKFPFVGNIEFQLEAQQEEIVSENEILTIGVHLPESSQGLENLKKGAQFIETTFPLKLSVESVNEGGTLGIQLMYYDPLVLVKINDKEFAVWNEETYVEMEEGMLLGIRDPDEEPLFIIETPQYLAGINSLDGFFFEISLQKFMQIISLAKQEFGNNILRFVYLAGSTRFVIFTSDGKVLYFNFPAGGNVENQWNSQIFKYNTLREKYDKFRNVEKIDLGSLENNKTIIKNY